MFSASISTTLGCSVNTDNSDLQAASFTQGQQHSIFERYVCVTQHSPSCSYVSPHGLFCAFSRSTGSGGVQHDVNSFCTSDFNIFLLRKNREDFLNLRMFLATGSTLRNLWKRDVRMYSTLPTLGDGTYGTLESSRLHLGDGMTISSVVPPISGEAWVDHLNKQGDQHLVVALTKEEFESVSASTEGVLNKLDGSVRQDKEWFQLILIVTAGDAIRTLAYHDSQGHTTRNGSTATVVAPRTNNVLISFVPDVANIMVHVSKGSCNTFQRGNCMVVFQVLVGHHYCLSAKGLSTLTVANLEGDPCQVFGSKTWSNDWSWTYQQPPHLPSVLESPPTHPLQFATVCNQAMCGVYGPGWYLHGALYHTAWTEQVHGRISGEPTCSRATRSQPQKGTPKPLGVSQHTRVRRRSLD